jgi:pimeloyl-ACP methyl ester carboxylesterase
MLRGWAARRGLPTCQTARLSGRRSLRRLAAFAEDVAIRRYGEQGNNIVHWSDFDRGGHFAAMETPDLLVGDVRAFFRRIR